MKVREVKIGVTVRELIECFGRRRLSFILDSAQANDGLGEWSFFGADPFAIISERGTGCGLRGVGKKLEPFLVGEQTGGSMRIPFIGGAVGFLSYDYGRRLEILPQVAEDVRSLPDLYFGLYDGIAALHHSSNRLYLVAHGIRADADTVLSELEQIIQTPLPSNPSSTGGASARKSDWEWNLTRDEFCKRVDTVRDYIARGDVYQVNLSRCARCQFEGDPLALYNALRRGNPAPYGAYIDMGATQIFSTSPEQFLRKVGEHIETRPIKGTRPRGESASDNIRQAEDLKLSGKDRAELLMIVDLERNDLGRIAEFGSVQVSEMYHQEHYARVIHQTARVSAKIAEGWDVFDSILALFPGGSITGAPKVRAMEIIETLEPTRRDVYCGSIGYIGFDENAEFNIAIRTLHLSGGILDYQVGGGIVWDSIPESEFQETIDKGCALSDAIEALCRK